MEVCEGVKHMTKDLFTPTQNNTTLIIINTSSDARHMRRKAIMKRDKRIWINQRESALYL